MVKGFVASVAGMAFAVLLLAACGQAAKAAEAATAEQIDRILLQLGDPDAQVREKASVLLKNLPVAAYPDVERVLEQHGDLDPETRARLTEVREDLRSLAAIARRVEELKKWNRENVLNDYEKFGSKNPAWNATAREALARAVEATWPQQPLDAKGREAFEAALATKCDDALFLYHYGLVGLRSGELDLHHGVLVLGRAAEAIAKSPYPAWRRCLVMGRYASNVGKTPAGWPDIPLNDDRKYLGLAMREFEKLGPDRGVPPAMLYEIGSMLVEAAHRERGGGMWTVQEVSKRMSKLAGGTAYALMFAARVEIDSTRYKYGVEGDATDEQRLAKAEELLERAYELDKSETRISTMMLDVTRRQGLDRQRMENWFKRAMQANPDNLEACNKKIRYLLESEENGQQAAVAFARELAAGQNWRGRLPFQLAEAHGLISTLQKSRLEYLARPDVWADVKAVHDRYLTLYPDNLYVRCWYANLAAKMRRWDEAHRQFQIIGNEPDLRVFISMESYNYLRKKAERLGGQPVGKSQ